MRRPVLIFLVSFLAWTSNASGQVERLWAVDDGTKVFQNALNHPLSKQNRTFDSDRNTVSLFGSRNETVAFQVIAEGGKKSSTLKLSTLALKGPDFVIENSFQSVPGSFLGRPIEFFREHYVQIRERSHDLGWRGGTDAEPQGLLNQWMPDALVPIKQTDSVRISAKKNQGFWIDIYIPTEAPPGNYVGFFKATGDGCSPCEITVKLNVFPIVLPKEPAVKTMLWFSGSDSDLDGMAIRYLKDAEPGDPRVVELRRKHFQLARQHLVTLFMSGDSAPNNELSLRLAGDLFTEKYGYSGLGEATGQDVYAINAYGVKELTSADSLKWKNWFKKIFPDIDYFYYVFDEPGEDDFAEVNERAKEAEHVPSFVTHGYTDELDVDIFASLPENFSRSGLKRALTAGKRYWIYNGVRPFSGSFLLDDVGVSPRINPWIQFKFAIERWFYWEATYYRDFQGKRGQIDVFSEAANFTNRHGDLANGDGLLIYPGTDLLFPKSSQKLGVPIPSIRLKNWRRGILDAAYLKLAAANGHEDFVKDLLNRLLPNVLAGETDARFPVVWPESGEAWLEARRLLAETIANGKASEIPSWLKANKSIFFESKLWIFANKRLALLVGAVGLVLGIILLTGLVIFIRRKKHK